jgi:hypothetical protein
MPDLPVQQANNREELDLSDENTDNFTDTGLKFCIE